MFEDFENRSGFWKDLGSNFTINYSGDAPSFLTSGEMWSAMDGSETQTLAAWENGWVLTNNPDGTMTATPKYTSGLISKTLVRVPVGPQTPMSSPTGGVGGVQVAFTADNKKFRAETIGCLEDLMKGGPNEFWSEVQYPSNAEWPTKDKMKIPTPGDKKHIFRMNEGYSMSWVSHWGGTWDATETGNGGVNGGGPTSNADSYPRTLTINSITKPNGDVLTFSECESGSNGGSNGSDPNDCAGENRALNTDNSCGDCLSDYTEDSNGDCIADEAEEEEGTNWLLWGGLAAVAVLAFTM